MTEEYSKLLNEQRKILGPISVLIASGTAVDLLVMGLGNSYSMAVFVLLPAIIAGLTSKFIGRPIQSRHKIIPSTIVSLVMLVSVINNGVHLIVFVAPFMSFGVCYFISSRNLSYEQEKIIYKQRIKSS